jgi:hypothetical protein
MLLKGGDSMMKLSENQIHDLVMLWLNKNNMTFNSIEELLKEYEDIYSQVKSYLPNISKMVKAGTYSL